MASGKYGMNRELNRPVEILLVEDNPADADLTIECFKDTNVTNNISVVQDGVEALAFLRRQGHYINSPRPDLILLDLNLPKRNGQEVLAEIKTDPDLKLIPVIVLTTSGAEQDILTAYQLHANCYIVKPIDFDQFVKIVESIEQFWFTIAELPSR
jgi:CheY-like chemotaxis protein